MTTVESYTRAKVDALIGATIVDADVVGGELIFTKEDGSTINLGAVGGGVTKVTAFPAVATDGDLIVHTGQVGDPMYKFTDGAWERQPRMGAQTVPAVKVYNATAVAGAIPNNVITAIPFDTEEYDTDGIHDLVTNTTRLTVKTPGLYIINGVMSFGGQTPVAGQRELVIKRNGVAIYDEELQVNSAATDWTSMPFSTTVRLAAGDYIEICLYQNSGNPVNYMGGVRWTAAMAWIGGAGQTVDERGVPAFQAKRTTNQAIPVSSNAIVALNSEIFDTDDAFDPVTTYRFTTKTPGLYRVSARVAWDTVSAAAVAMDLYKNGAQIERLGWLTSGAGSGAELQGSVLVLLAAGDTISLSATNYDGASVRNVTAARLDASLMGSGKSVSPYCRAYRSTVQAIPSGGSPSALAFNVERADNDGIHDTASNTSRFVCRTAGVYKVGGNVVFANDNNGVRQMWLRVTRASGGVDDVAIFERGNNVGGGSVIVTGEVTTEMAVGDYLEVCAYQNSVNGTLNTAWGSGPTGQYGAEGWIAKIGAPSGGPLEIPVPPGSWHQVGAAGEVPYKNTFVTSFRPLMFAKDADGLVRFRGIVQSPNPAMAAGTPIFTLPAGYRPIDIMTFIVPTTQSDASVRTLRVAANGDVTAGSGSAWPTGEYIDFAQVSFRGEL